jgi:hypothetical protein
MRSSLAACAFFLGAMSAVPALANMCVSDSGRRCATGMPVDGYCMCGNEGGTVVGPHQTAMPSAPPPNYAPSYNPPPPPPPGYPSAPPPGYPSAPPPGYPSGPPPSYPPYRPPPPPQ